SGGLVMRKKWRSVGLLTGMLMLAVGLARGQFECVEMTTCRLADVTQCTGTCTGAGYANPCSSLTITRYTNQFWNTVQSPGPCSETDTEWVDCYSTTACQQITVESSTCPA